MKWEYNDYEILYLSAFPRWKLSRLYDEYILNAPFLELQVSHTLCYVTTSTPSRARRGFILSDYHAD